jgi:hypothetical protein
MLDPSPERGGASAFCQLAERGEEESSRGIQVLFAMHLEQPIQIT